MTRTRKMTEAITGPWQMMSPVEIAEYIAALPDGVDSVERRLAETAAMLYAWHDLDQQDISELTK